MKARRARARFARASLLASVAVVSGVLAPATAGASSGTTTTTIPVRANAQLVIWTDAQRAPVILPFARKFGKQYGISVAVTPDSNLPSDYETATLAGKGPDIVVGASDYIGGLVANGTIQPLAMPTMEQSLFNPIAINAMKYQGEIWGVPYAIENIALFRNPALVPNAPSTFEQMASEGLALVKAGKAKVPFADQVGTTGDAYHMEPFYTSGGGYLFGTLKNGDYNAKDVGVGLAGSIAAAKLIYKYGEKGDGLFTQNINSSNSISLFASGQSPFLVSGPWALPTIQAAHRAYKLSAIPGFAGYGPTRPFLGVQAFFVSSKAKNAALAEQFVLDYVASPAVQSALFKVEPRPAALKSVLAQEMSTDPDVSAWFAAAKYGQPLPGIPAMAAIWGPLGQAEANIVAGMDPTTQMAEARAAILKAIKAQG
jgi:arabinogalactan oligomer/maltooligosaccharide transport system substrate-binding protein